jgi:predicted nucleotidyltransferase
MNRIVTEKASALRSLAERHGVRRLCLFGSAVREDFDPATSDIDFLVEFIPNPPAGRANSYFGLLEDLEQLFGRRVDLVELAAIRNPYFAREIAATEQPVYEAA